MINGKLFSLFTMLETLIETNIFTIMYINVNVVFHGDFEGDGQISSILRESSKLFSFLFRSIAILKSAAWL